MLFRFSYLSMVSVFFQIGVGDKLKRMRRQLAFAVDYNSARQGSTQSESIVGALAQSHADNRSLDIEFGAVVVHPPELPSNTHVLMTHATAPLNKSRPSRRNPIALDYENNCLAEPVAMSGPNRA